MIAYFTSEYPKVSHSFVRREICALEESGCAVMRFALRGWDTVVVDPSDISERARTEFLLKNGVLPLIWATVIVALRHPRRFLTALCLSLRMMRRSDRTIPLHVISLCEAASLALHLIAGKVTHLHVHFGTNPAEVGMLAATLADIPYSFTVHGPDEFDRPEQLKLGLKVERAKFVAAISSYCASQIFRWSAPSDWHKVKIVKCGISALFLDREDLLPISSKARFVSVARLSAQKGHLLTLEAIAILSRAGIDVELVLVGDGELRETVEATIDRLAIQKNVTITGWADERAVRAAIVQSRALLLPSFAEGLPVVIMEALALERPVLASNVAAVSELVETGKTGWLFQPGSVDAIVDAMKACLSTRSEDLDHLGKTGRALIAQRHDIMTEAAKLAALFQPAQSQAPAPSLAPVPG